MLGCGGGPNVHPALKNDLATTLVNMYGPSSEYLILHVALHVA